jgi:hypothetical protein
MDATERADTAIGRHVLMQHPYCHSGMHCTHPSYSHTRKLRNCSAAVAAEAAQDAAAAVAAARDDAESGGRARETLNLPTQPCRPTQDQSAISTGNRGKRNKRCKLVAMSGGVALRYTPRSLRLQSIRSG